MLHLALMLQRSMTTTLFTHTLPTMRTTQNATRTRHKTNDLPHAPKVALALAGGGPLGAIYEIGALCALDEVLEGANLVNCNHYVGVSAGGFIAAGLANGMTPRELCELFIQSQSDNGDVFDPAWLMRPAYAEIAQRLCQLPGLGMASLWAWTSGSKSLLGALEKLAPAMPTGIFSNEEIHIQLAKLFSQPGRTNDFRKLTRRLTLVATHLDSGDAAPFGRAGWDHVPISRAIAASAALPGLFPPVEIDGRFYVDGALKKTMHATVALDEGADVMFCLNPLVPFDSTPAPQQRVGGTASKPIPSLVDGGFPAVMNQTFRSMIHSRLELGMKQYERSYPHTAIILIEPDHRDAEFYTANTFSYRQRRGLAEHAYQQTRLMLRTRYTTLMGQLRPHGMGLNRAVLDDTARTLLPPTHIERASASRLNAAISRLQDSVDDLQHAIASGAVELSAGRAH